ncbi:hypothetical protein HBH79_174550 [Parastagonospora nodorum]|nr:hypothetical protein HBH46_168430 [Parastagonospora nodorum]KAH4141253.1 hypothetical protein HBH45_072170 [Parastagonospora nodorum]KAH4365021.1 hypothetical protein HBH94_160060 [Parastagonospora nodorum]KAH4428120.1 hypothetical protein HBH93_164020 [Parastagonospora nodorum]KAH4574935.1 hypothetical protein HBH84_085940 [Parastagonospora nodorum]
MRVVGQRLFEANSAGSASSEQFTLALQSGRQARRGDDCSGGSHWRLRLIATLHETRGTEHLRAFACHPPTPRVRQRALSRGSGILPHSQTTNSSVACSLLANRFESILCT